MACGYINVLSWPLLCILMPSLLCSLELWLVIATKVMVAMYMVGEFVNHMFRLIDRSNCSPC